MTIGSIFKFQKNLIQIYCFLVVIFLITACSSKSQLEVTPSRLEVTPSSISLIDFESTNTYPLNSFLFIGVSYSTRCTNSCDCIVLEEIREAYRYENNTLYLVRWFLDNQPTTWSEYTENKDFIGLYSYWKPDDAQFITIKSLPRNLENTNFKVKEFDLDGNVMININFDEFILEVSKTANYSWIETKINDCFITHNYKITNLGFINHTQVIIEE